VTVRVGFFQFAPRFGRPDENCRVVVRALRGVDADLIVLPELAFTGYRFRDRKELSGLAEDPRRSAIVDSLVALCRDRGLHLVTGWAERSRDKIFNSALLLSPRGLVQTYRKVHLFDRETGWFDPGDTPFEVRAIRGFRVGMMVCFDWVFPEAARSLGLAGVDLVAHPSNLVLDYCQRVMVARCIENGIFAVTANRSGEERGLRFTGRSQVVDPRGKVLVRAPTSRTRLGLVDVDPARARDKRITGRNHLLRDRRPEMYPGLD